MKTQTILALVITLALSSCGTPGTGPTAGEQAVLAASLAMYGDQTPLAVRQAKFDAIRRANGL